MSGEQALQIYLWRSNIDTPPIPDDRPQRRREYSGAGSTLGLAMLIIVIVGVAIWWFELRGAGSATGFQAKGLGIVETPVETNITGRPPAADDGRLAPNFRLSLLDGGEQNLSDYRGRFVLLNFWASWCGPCREETPDLQRLSEQVPGLAVLGVNQQEDPASVRAFVKEIQPKYPILLDRSGEVSLGYRVGLGLPVTFLVDPDGVIQRIYPGRFKRQALDQLHGCLLKPAAEIVACIRSDG